MIDFERFWKEGNDPYEDSESETEAPPGVSPEEILAWERQSGVKLPEPLRTALKIRNGGYVRNTDIEVLPLDQFEPVDDDFWEHTEIEEDEAPNHDLVFVFGNETQIGGTFLMNFNAEGPGGSPSVYLDMHGESTYRMNDTIAGFFDEQLASDDEPSVDWSEADASRSVIARETFDLTAEYDGEPASKDQVLIKEGDVLILFSRSRSPEGESLSRMTLPLPLNPNPFDPTQFAPVSTTRFLLHLEPKEREGIVMEQSEKNDEGRWKNSTDHGVPIFAIFEAANRERLEALRTQLFGREVAAEIRARQGQRAATEAMLGTLTPEQRSAAFLQAAMNRRAEVESQLAFDLGDADRLPPELAEAAKFMRQRMEQMAEMVRQKAAANPPDAETIHRVEDYLRDQGGS